MSSLNHLRCTVETITNHTQYTLAQLAVRLHRNEKHDDKATASWQLAKTTVSKCLRPSRYNHSMPLHLGFLSRPSS